MRYSPLCLERARTSTTATTTSSRKMNASTAVTSATFNISENSISSAEKASSTDCRGWPRRCGGSPARPAGRWAAAGASPAPARGASPVPRRRSPRAGCRLHTTWKIQKTAVFLNRIRTVFLTWYHRYDQTDTEFVKILPTDKFADASSIFNLRKRR